MKAEKKSRSALSEKPFQKARKFSAVSEKGGWELQHRLFSPLSESEISIMNNFQEILEEVWPLKRKHREQLPGDIANLSRQMTSNRNELGKNYWGKAENISAYLYYFLPWNLIRFIKILKDFPLGEPEIRAGLKPVIYDAAAGPLTLSIALWIARPKWREKSLHIFAQDKIARPLELGKKLLDSLASHYGVNAWETSIATGSLFALPEIAKRQPGLAGVYPFLIGTANTLNELKMPASFEKHHPLSFEELLTNMQVESDKKEEIFYALLYSWSELWQNSMPQLLFIEPGTRLGGSSLMQLREAASLFNLASVSPCPQVKGCPFLSDDSKSSSSYQKRWCHFTFSAMEAPEWLQKLSVASGLEKKALSLSALLLESRDIPKKKDLGNLCGRVVSGAFKVPDLKGKCRYACSKKGILLLEDAEKLESGDMIRVTWPDKPEKDKKSQAIRIRQKVYAKKTGAQYGEA